MGLMFRPRRPLMRVAAGAATATVAYKAGQRRTEQNQYNEQAAYSQTQAAPPQAAPAPHLLPRWTRRPRSSVSPSCTSRGP
jgi:hypothetical protein